jgi:hypothetical protein
MARQSHRKLPRDLGGSLEDGQQSEPWPLPLVSQSGVLATMEPFGPLKHPVDLLQGQPQSSVVPSSASPVC